MVSTNHFRNRKLARNRAVVVRQPCTCPTLVIPTPPPVVLPAVTWGWNGDGSFADDIPSHSGTFIRGDATYWLEFGVTDFPNPYMLIVQWDPTGPALRGDLYLPSGGIFQRVDTVNFGAYAGTEPYGPDTEPWALVPQPPGDDATITLTTPWSPP